jgi:hypothetical protein
MQQVARPDVDRLIIGGRRRKRRRNVTRAGSAALVVTLIGGGAYGFTQLVDADPGTTGIVDQPTPTAGPVSAAADLPADPGSDTLEPGTYRVLVGTDGAGARIQADLTFEDPNWVAGDSPVLEDDGAFGGLAVYRPVALAAGSGCSDDLVTTNLGESSFSLAQKLAELPGSTVVQPVAPSEVLGQYAVHLRVRIPQSCPVPQYYRPAVTPRGDRGITYDRPDQTLPPVVMDFWVLELDGVSVVVDSWHQVGASAELVDEIDRARESITFVTDE